MMRLLCTAILTCLGTLQSAPAGTTADQRRAVDRLFSEFHNGTPGCAVGVTVGGSTVFEAGYGMADLERRVPISAQTVFESGSVAKQFTAAALILLETQGKLSLDDPLAKHVPELLPLGNRITIRHVLHHTSGLREWRLLAALDGQPEGSKVYSNQDILAIASRQRGLNFDPGTHYSYSNTGFNIAPILIERVLGGTQSFPAFTREAIFEPLGMTDSRWRDNFREVVPGRALAYGRTGGGWVNQTPIENIIGAGGLLTTVGDLLKWSDNFRHGRVGGESLLTSLQKPARLTSGREIDYASGLRVGRHRGLREVSHSGATGGYRTWLGHYPDQAVSVAVLCNGADADAVQLGRETAAVWTGGSSTVPSGRRAAPATGLGGLAGIYYSPRDHRVQKLEMRGDAGYFGGTKLFQTDGNGFLLGSTPEAGMLEVVGRSPIRLKQSNSADEVVWQRMEADGPPSLAALGAFAGRYSTPEVLEPVLIALSSSGTLALRKGATGLSSAPAEALNHVAGDLFVTTTGLTVRFLRNERGDVISLAIGDARTWDVRFRKETQ